MLYLSAVVVVFMLLLVVAAREAMLFYLWLDELQQFREVHTSKAQEDAVRE
jgi:hypothetical protein